MAIFRVWAPLAESVDVQVDAKRHPLDRRSGGWWEVEVPSATPGAEYGFIVDGEGPLPDPRSPWQPEGVHGLSRTIDHAEFKWSDAGFQAAPLSSALIYELHVGTFTTEGTLDAAIGKLDYLAELGVTHVELMPVNAFPGRHGWGYDGVSLFAVHEPYGGPQALKRFVNACHGRHLAVLLDVVYNHLGPSGNYLARFAPYLNPNYKTPWGPALNFSGAHSDEVRRFFCDNALMWLRDYHFDGLRLDAVHAIVDTLPVHFLEQLAQETSELEAQTARHLTLIAESDLNDPRLLWPPEHGGFGLHAQWSDDFHHALHTVLTGERKGYYEDFATLGDLAKALANAFVYDGQYSNHRRRRHGRPHGGLSGHRFLGYLQNHDQVGNRADGRRISSMLNPARLKIGAALVLTSPFVPMLFMGEEWGASTPFLYFADHQENHLAEAVREGRRREFAAFGWPPDTIPDPQAQKTFDMSKLDWSELDREPHAEIHSWYRQLIHLRRSEPALLDGALNEIRTRFDEVARWFCIERGPITILCNFSDAAQRFTLRPGRHKVLLSSAVLSPPVEHELALPGSSIAILKLA